MEPGSKIREYVDLIHQCSAEQRAGIIHRDTSKSWSRKLRQQLDKSFQQSCIDVTVLFPMLDLNQLEAMA
jgi:hypothetical protein